MNIMHQMCHHRGLSHDDCTRIWEGKSRSGIYFFYRPAYAEQNTAIFNDARRKESFVAKLLQPNLYSFQIISMRTYG